MRFSAAPAPKLIDEPARLPTVHETRQADRFLRAAHSAGFHGVDRLHEFAIANGWDAWTVHFAVGRECFTCGHSVAFHQSGYQCVTLNDCQCWEFTPLPEEADCA